MAKAPAQLVEDGEAMGVDVAPVIQLAELQPVASLQLLEAVPGTEQDHRASGRGEGEEVDLVFGDENLRGRAAQFTEAVGIERDIAAAHAWQHGHRRIEQPEAQLRGLGLEAIALD